MILLIENIRDRIGGIEKSSIDFSKYSENIEVILYDEKCNKLLDNFLENNSYFDKYDTIIIHESIYHQDKRETLFKLLKEYTKNKTLVKFSGNNSQASFSKNILTLTPSKLYQNLETFLKDDNPNILMLAYGKHWDLNPLLNNLEKLNIFIETFDKNSKVRSSKFKNDFGLFQLKKILKENEYQSLFNNLDFGDDVSKEEMNILSYNFKILIQNKATH